MFSSLRSLTSILMVAGITAASPLTPRDTPALYNLQTKVVGNSTDCGTNKTGLWLYSSHTGAGLGDAALSSNRSVAWEGYLNGTQALFTYPNSPYPWPMYVEYGPYQAWELVTISVAGQSSDDQQFFFNETGFQFSQYTEASPGWLACDWWHGDVQLFSLAAGYYPTKYPAGCSKVELYPIGL